MADAVNPFAEVDQEVIRRGERFLSMLASCALFLIGSIITSPFGWQRSACLIGLGFTIAEVLHRAIQYLDAQSAANKARLDAMRGKCDPQDMP